MDSSNQNRNQPEPSIKDKILGFLGMGKPPEPVKEREPKRSTGPDRSTGAQARQRAEKNRPKSRPKQQHQQQREPAEVTSARLHVGNLNYDATDEDLSGLFKDAGTVVSAEVVTNPHSGRSKGFAFVEMSSIEEAKAVAEKFHGQDLMGRDLVISGAKSKGPRESDGPRGDREQGRGRDRDRNRDDRRSGDEGGGSRDRDRGESRPPRERKSRAEREQRGRSGGGTPPEGVERFDEAPKQKSTVKVDSTHLKVENLDPAILEGDLKGLFGGLGTILAFEVSEDTATVELRDLAEAQRSVDVLNGKKFMGRTLKLSVLEGKASTEPSDEAPAEEPASEPEASEPEASEPEASEPEASEPEAAEPEASEPEASEPEAAEPEASEPEAESGEEKNEN